MPRAVEGIEGTRRFRVFALEDQTIPSRALRAALAHLLLYSTSPDGVRSFLLRDGRRCFWFVRECASWLLQDPGCLGTG